MEKKIPYLLGLVLTILTLWVFATSNVAVRAVIERLNSIVYDLQLRAHIYTSPRAKVSPIVIIDIDDKSLNAEGQWPWPREKLATLVEYLQLQHITAIVFDVIFAEKEPNIVDILLTKIKSLPNVTSYCAQGLKENINLFAGDKIFAKSILNKNVILANTYLLKDYTQNSLPAPILYISKELQKHLSIRTALGFIGNIPEIQQAARGVGFITIEQDSDGIARRANLIFQYKDGIYPSLAVETIRTIFSDSFGLVTPIYENKVKLEGIQLGSLFIPTDEKGRVLIPFVGGRGTFPVYSATDVMNNRVPSNVFTGKIILIGTSALGLGDIHATSISKLLPGTEIQATLINGILQNNFSYIPFWTYGANFSFIIIFGLLGTFLFPSFGPRLLGLAILFIPIILFTFNNFIWTYFNYVFSSILPVLLIILLALVNLIYGYLFETKKREYLRSIFGQYVPEAHINEMMKSKDALSLHGEDREMTVLFTDIRNFTTISEKLDATALVKMLNDFFTPMTEIIFKHHGTIDKYVGDQLDAFWGAPLKDKRHAQNALSCALEMSQKLKTMKDLWKKQNLPEISIGIGISTGHMSVGDMGSRYRRNYTVQGDAANLGSRLEGLTKIYGVEIIVSETTKHNQPKFVFRRLGRVRVKGKEIPTEIFELVCLKSELTDELRHEIDLYHQALDYYYQQQWDQAHGILVALIKKYPGNKLYSLFLLRLNEYKINPPPQDWDGTYIHTSK